MCSCRDVWRVCALEKAGGEGATGGRRLVPDRECEGWRPLARLPSEAVTFKKMCSHPATPCVGHWRSPWACLGGPSGLGNLGTGRAGNLLTRLSERGSEPRGRNFLVVRHRNVTQQELPGIPATAMAVPGRPLTP